jgi:hypothetical protein
LRSVQGQLGDKEFVQLFCYSAPILKRKKQCPNFKSRNDWEYPDEKNNQKVERTLTVSYMAPTGETRTRKLCVNKPINISLIKASFPTFSFRYFSVLPFIAMRDWTGSSSQPRNFETNKQQLMTLAGGGVGQMAPTIRR